MKCEFTTLKMCEAEEVRKVLDANSAFYDDIGYDRECVYVYISWGDWKHDHMFVKNLVRNLYPECTIETIVTEEDGSDCYSAKHIIRF